jgi:hypothetical protein
MNGLTHHSISLREKPRRPVNSNGGPLNHEPPRHLSSLGSLSRATNCSLVFVAVSPAQTFNLFVLRAYAVEGKVKPPGYVVI